MADVRGARRAAEKAARERLGGPLIAAVGQLGVAVAERHAAGEQVGVAEDRAREHVRRAQQEAEEMVAAARAQVTVTEDSYRQAHDAAVAAGWSPAALSDMGYPAPTATRRTRAQTTTPAASVDPAPVDEEQASPSDPALDAVAQGVAGDAQVDAA